MSIIENGIVVNSDNTISFGNHVATTKVKIDNFKIGEDVFKLRTYNEVTRLTKNHDLVFESTPGVTVHKFYNTKKIVKFEVEGSADAQITLELNPDSTYKVLLNDNLLNEVKANSISGKISFSVEFIDGKGKVVVEEV